nr:Chain B, Bicyclic peptide inhibitor [synthetic construct]
ACSRYEVDCRGRGSACG